MKKLLFILFLLLSFESQASFNIYAVGNLGVFAHGSSQEKFFSLDKYGGGLGFEWALLSFLSVGSELTYIRGISRDCLPTILKETLSISSYGGFKNRGVDFINVHYFELWLRPKFILPLPLIQPYAVMLISPLSIGGIRGYPSPGFGLGGAVGLQSSIFSLTLFVESGAVVRMRKVNDIGFRPWGMFDLTIPINAGLGYSF